MQCTLHPSDWSRAQAPGVCCKDCRTTVHNKLSDGHNQQATAPADVDQPDDPSSTVPSSCWLKTPTQAPGQQRTAAQGSLQQVLGAC
jgi:hypothetical protein